jgi:hypothetical protein
MTSTSFRLLGRTLVATCAVISALAGCGDGPVCQVESLVFISSPQGPIITDSDPRVDGIQQDVVVKSTFSGAAVTLTVTDADDAVVATLTGRTDDDGNFTFADVTIPTTGASLRVDADAGQCGNDSDEVAVALIGGGDCAIAFATPPVANPFYAPLDVWNAAADADPATAGFQGDTLITARPGEQVKLFLSAPGVPETEVAAGTVGDTGTVSLATSAPEGQVNLRAECGVADGVTSRSSGVTSIFVDTVAPACAMIEPIPGTSITPGLDANNDLSDGIQVTLRGAGDGGDGEGETASFTITEPGGGTTALVGTDRDATGQSTAAASFDPATSPADYSVRFATADHAGNACMVDQAYRVVLAGCTITVSAPTGTVTADADGDGTNGAQIDITASAPECVGQTITSDCGSTDPSVVVGAGGAIALRATVCDGVPCEATEMCTLRVTSTDGIETTAGVNLAFDNLAPNVAVTVSQPVGVACGGTVTPAQDQDAAAAGVQVRMRVTAPLSVSRSLDVTSGAATVTLPVTAPGGEVFATVVPGANTMVGHATDGAGNIGTSVSCVVNLADIAVNFTGSPADGTVGGADGTVSGSTLTFALTGTASVAGATVMVTVDGGAPQAATVTGTAWSLTLALAGRAAPYTIVATATLTPRTGSATLPLLVDLTPPGTPTGLTAIADTRQSIRLGFTAPAGAASYRVKFATTALTDANFDATGTAVTAPTPGAAGSAETVRVRPLRAGTAYWVAVASVDDAGNRSAAQVAGPLTPRFDQAAVVGAPNTVGDAGFGLAMVRGKFNDDDFEDVAVSAPFVTAGGVAGAGEVYVYFGSATGLATTPGVTIRGVTADAAFGSALTAVRWSSTDPQRPGGRRAVRRRRQRRDLRVERRRRVPDRRDHAGQRAAAHRRRHHRELVLGQRARLAARRRGPRRRRHRRSHHHRGVRQRRRGGRGAGVLRRHRARRHRPDLGHLGGGQRHRGGADVRGGRPQPVRLLPAQRRADDRRRRCGRRPRGGLRRGRRGRRRRRGAALDRRSPGRARRHPRAVHGRPRRARPRQHQRHVARVGLDGQLRDRSQRQRRPRAGVRRLSLCRGRRHRRGGRWRGARHRRRPHAQPVRHGHADDDRRRDRQRALRHADREQRQRDHPRRRRRRHRGPAGRGDGRRGGGDERVVWPDPARGAAHDRAQSPDQWSGQLRRGDPGHRRVADHGDLGGRRER